MRHCIFFSFFILYFGSCALAGTIIKQRHADGQIEFSNVPPHSTAKQTVIYKSKYGDSVLFSDQKPAQADYEILRYDCYACRLDSTIDWNTVKLYLTPFRHEINQAAKAHHLDPALIRSIIHAESGFNPKAQSHKGAQGLMQLMLETAQNLGVNNRFDPAQNIRAGSRYLAQLLKRFNGNMQFAAAAYNAGPSAVEKYHGIPPYKETRVYVKRVQILYHRYQQALRDN